ncbi:MAG: divalent cation tolerance protein CutA, partial [Nitrospirota bacterium]|nr:divalent cation tolerance protein CutA [Nitrospirota bacterium]
VKEYHHYSVPEIIAVPLVSGTEDYLMWVRENTKGKNHE